MTARADRTGAERRGRRAERLAAFWLRLKGYRILARRHRTPLGELDLVARKGAALIAVEVKARGRLEDAVAAVSPRQRQRIARALRQFQASRPATAGLDLRIDLVIVRPWRRPLHLADVWRPDQI